MNNSIEGIPYSILDPEIRTLIRLINKFPGLSTTDSCIGHEPYESCYVAIKANRQEDFKRLINAMPFWGQQCGFSFNEPWRKMIWATVMQDMRYILYIEGHPYHVQRKAVGEVERSLKEEINLL